MTEQELEIAKKIAEIDFSADDGYSVSAKYGAIWVSNSYTCGQNEYNPFSWSILGPLMVKYGVSLLKEDWYYKVVPEGMAFSIDCLPKNLEQAILECIIKSQGVEL